MMFSWPGKIAPQNRTELVSSIDIVPTILAAAKVDKPRQLPGISLLPYVTTEKKITRQTVFGEGFAHDIADLDDPEASLLYRWCIDGNWKLILTYDGEINRYKSTHPRDEIRPQLFDLDKDPDELANLAKDHPEIVKRLANQISNWYPVKSRSVETEFKTDSRK